MKNIVLIGMPGCGKSTIGPLLAKRTGRTFLETDRMIEEKAAKSIPEIFASDGEAAFRALETLCAKEAGSHSGAVIATGGGIILKKENLDALKENGIVIFLHRPLQNILSGDLSARPLLQDDRALQLSTLCWQRIGLYRKYADLCISNIGSPETVLPSLLEAIKEHLV